MPNHSTRTARQLGRARFIWLRLLAVASVTAWAHAQTWTGTTDGTFSSASNWSPGLPANDGTATATFGAASTTTINLDTPWSLSGMVFSSGASDYAFGSGNNSTLTLGSGGISASGNATTGFSNAIVLGATSVPLSAANSGTLNLSGVVSGSGGIAVTGSGLVMLSGGSNTYTGGTTVSAGAALSVAGDSSLGAVPTVATPGSITLNGGALIIQGGSLNSKRGIAVTDGSTISFPSSGNFTYGGILTGSGGLTIVSGGTGTLTLSGADTFSGTLTVANSGGLSLSGGSLSSATVNLTQGSLMISNNVTIGGLSGNQTVAYTNNIVVKTLSIGSNTMSTTFAGVLSGSKLNVAKIGTGTLTLSGNSNYGGTTTVTSGALMISGSLSGGGAVTVSNATLLVTGNLFGTGTVKVNSGGTLGGTGSIAGSTTVQSGGVLSPGNGGPGTLTFAHNLTLAGGSSLNFDLGGSSDKILLTGGLLSASGVTVNVLDGSGFGPGTFLLIDFTGATSSGLLASSFMVGSAPSGYDYSFAIAGSDLDLTVTSAVPEPSTCALIFGGASLGLAAWRRRRLRRGPAPRALN